MRNAGEGALGEDRVHLRPHLRLWLHEVIRVPYSHLAVVTDREQSKSQRVVEFEFSAICLSRE